MSGTLVAQSAKRNQIMDALRGPQMLETLRRVLPKTTTPERFIIVVQTEIKKLPGLLDCTNTLPAFLQAAKLGLEPGVLGQCWVIPFKRNAVLIPGYRGLTQLAYRSGLVKSLIARPVFDGDLFSFDYGTSAGIKHRPSGESDSKLLTHVYAIAETTAGGMLFHVMTKKEVDLRRARSRAGAKEGSPWDTDYVPMACKTAALTLCKWLPLSPDMQRVAVLDEESERPDGQVFDPDVEVPEFTIEPDDPESPEERQPGEEG